MNEIWTFTVVDHNLLADDRDSWRTNLPTKYFSSRERAIEGLKRELKEIWDGCESTEPMPEANLLPAGDDSVWEADWCCLTLVVWSLDEGGN